MASNISARFAEGEDTQQLGSDTQTLQQQGWALDSEGMGVTKTFHFKSYFKAVVGDLGNYAGNSTDSCGQVLCQYDCG